MAGMSTTMMMQFMPLLEETKMDMCTELMEISMPIFKDMTVIMLMALVRMFESEHYEGIKQMKNRYLALLRGYVQENTKNAVGFDMQQVIKCFNALPKFYKIFKEM